VTSYHSMPDPTPEYEGDGDDEEDRTLRGRASMPSSSQSASRESSASRPHRNSYSYRDDHSLGSSTDGPSVQNRPMLEIPEEIYAVRKAALQVLKPLTKTWVCISHLATNKEGLCMLRNLLFSPPYRMHRRW